MFAVLVFSSASGVASKPLLAATLVQVDVQPDAARSNQRPDHWPVSVGKPMEDVAALRATCDTQAEHEQR
jgi:hypothetical protein